MEIAPTSEITLEELQLAARNHWLPLEALRYPITPIGLQRIFESGPCVLQGRASDAAGHTQPAVAVWNYDGFCNNAVQRIRVAVR